MTKQPCSSCGADILPETAARTGGRCRPCANGTREAIDTGIRYQVEQRTRDNDPFWQKWLELSGRVRGDGFESLSPNEQAFFAMNHLKGSVFRGGFLTYFEMASAIEIRVAGESFRVNGAPQLSEILSRVVALLFPSGLPASIAELRERLPTWTEEEIGGDLEPEWSRRLGSLEREFYSTGDLGYAVVERFFAEHFGGSSVDVDPGGAA